MNLIEAIQKENSRCRDLVKIYESLRNGKFAAESIKQVIFEAEQCISQGDTIGMIRILQRLQACS